MALTEQQAKAFNEAVTDIAHNAADGIDTLLHAKTQLAIRIAEEFPDMGENFAMCAKMADAHVENYVGFVRDQVHAKGSRISREVIGRSLKNETRSMYFEKVISIMRVQKAERDANIRRKRDARYPSAG